MKKLKDLELGFSSARPSRNTTDQTSIFQVPIVLLAYRGNRTERGQVLLQPIDALLRELFVHEMLNLILCFQDAGLFFEEMLHSLTLLQKSNVRASPNSH